jgi:WD40 repeat protein
MSASARSGNPDVPIPFGACDPSGTFVFVSYAHGDKALVYPELRRIRSFGIRVWYDEGIEPGSEWPEAIAAALNRAAAFVVMITPGAVASRNVRNEINAALRWGKPVFAVHLAQTELPKGLELQMGAVQAVMRWRMDEASYTRKLGKALASYGEAMNEAPPAEPPALTVSRANTPTPPPPLTPSPVPLSRLARTLTGHTKAVWDVTFSPDGRLLVTSGSDGTARMWDPATGEQLRVLAAHQDGVSGVAFSPDGNLLATAGADRTARVWDPVTGKQIRTLTGHEEWLFGVAFSPDGRLLATAGGNDKTARVWNPVTGKQLRVLSGHDDTVHAVAFSPDGRLLVTGGDRTARVWNPATGRHLRTLTGNTGGVHSVAFSPDGRLLATGSYDRTVRVWDPPAGRHLRLPATGRHLRTLTGHTDQIHAVAFSPDGHLLAAGSSDQTARVWDLATGRQLRTLTGHTGGIFGLAFSPDGHLLVTVSGDKTARVWD